MLQRMVASLAVAGGVLLVAPDALAFATDWGTMRGRYVLASSSEQPGRQSPTIAASDGSSASDLSDVIIWLCPEDRKIPIHPTHLQHHGATVDLTIKDGRWSPPILVFTAGSTLAVHNRDQHFHDGFPDVFTDNDTLQVDDYEIVYEKQPLILAKTIFFPSRSTTKILKVPAWPHPCVYSSSLPAKVVHRAVMFCAPTPYWAVADQDGRFLMKNLPVGKWRFRAWHRDIGFVKVVPTAAKGVEGERGLFEFEVIAGDNDVGTITVSGDSLHQRR